VFDQVTASLVGPDYICRYTMTPTGTVAHRPEAGPTVKSQFERVYRGARHRVADFVYPPAKAWCDRRAAHEAALATAATAPASTAPSAPESPYPLRPATGAGALTVVSDIPPFTVNYQDPKEAVKSIAAFVTETRPAAEPGSGPGAELARRVSEVSWYHTIELPHGVVTPGTYDHRPLVPHLGFPDSLSGLRALDVAAADGFWSFEMERRGATVTALDLSHFLEVDFPPVVRAELIRQGVDRKSGEGFELAHTALGSSVTRLERSIYTLDPQDLGTFDFVHLADVLLHLEHPLDALRSVHSVTGGQALIVETIDGLVPPGSVRYVGDWGQVTYWVPGLQAMVQLVADAGFSSIKVHNLFSLAVTSPDAVGPWRVVMIAEP
jgi:tRNA (mo5U34)-methyltransferase